MFAANILILITQICVISTEIIIPENTDELSQCFGKISILFKGTHLLYFNPHKNEDEILHLFHKNGNLITTVSNLKQRQDEIIFYDVYLIAVKNSDDFNHLVHRILSSKGKYLIIYYGHPDISGEILKIAWKYYLFHINVITITENKIIFTTYVSYTNNNNKDCHSEISNYSRSCDEINTMEDLFPNKVPLDLNGCETKFGLFVKPPLIIDPIDPKFEHGLQFILLKTILKWINSKGNLTIVADDTGLGIIHPNGSITGPLSSLKPHETDIVFGNLYPNITFLKYTDILYPFFMDNSRWYAPKPSQLAKWKCLYVILQGKLWALIFVFFVVNAFIWWGIAKHTKDIQPLRSLGYCLLFGFYILCLGSTPLPNKLILRILVISWTLFGLLVAVMYQSQLLTILTSPIYEHQIKDVDELPGSKLRFLAPAIILDGVRQFPSKEIRDYLLKNGDFVEMEELYQRMIPYNRNFVFLATYYWMKYVAALYYTNEDGSAMVYDLYNENYTTYSVPICGYATKGFPLFNRINELGFRLQNAGFLAKWIKDVDTTFYGNVAKEPVRLTLDHVAGAFFLLLCGLVVSMVGFLAEVVVDKFEIRKRRFQ